MRKLIVLFCLCGVAGGLQAQTDRVTWLQSARNLTITTTDGNTDYHMVTTDKSLIFHKNGNELTLNGQTMQMSDIKKMRLVTPQKFVLNEDSTTFTPKAVNHGLLAFRYGCQLGQWNTIVLPCSLTGLQVTETFGEGTQLAYYSGITENDAAQIDLELLDLNTEETVLQANTYYLIRPTREPDIAVGNTTSVNYGSAKVGGPVYLIYDVSMEKGKEFVANQSLRSADGNVSMSVRGTFMTQDVYYNSSTGKRAFFWLDDEGLFRQSTDAVATKAFRNWVVFVKNANELPLRFYVNGINEDLTSTGIETMYNVPCTKDHQVYDLQGRKMVHGTWSDGTLPKGIYIINGKKTVVR